MTSIVRKNIVCFGLFVVLMLFFSACREDSLSPMNPHMAGMTGPFFEGWYYRLTDPDSGAKIAVIFASYLRPETVYEPGMDMPGYLAVLVSRDGVSETIELFPEETSLLKDGLPVNDIFALDAPVDFEWRCPYGSISQSSVDIDVPGSFSLNAKMENRMPWYENSELGPEGIMMFVKAVKSHWYVYSLGSDVSYELSLNRDGNMETCTGTGYIHQEKNWGDTFPSAWIWLEGVNEDNSANIALSGGKVPMGGDYMTSWLAGYRSPTLSLNYIAGEEIPIAALPAGTIVHTEIDACAGTFYFSAVSPRQKFIVDASAPVDTFFHIAIPTTEGFMQNGGVESFDATIIVSVYKDRNGHSTLIEKNVFEGAALEFGAGYMCE